MRSEKSVPVVVLIIRDGWGIRSDPKNNAVADAETPNVDRYHATYPWAAVGASGADVGLPDGYQGSSEVGHLNMGAGRIVKQELTRINEALEGGEIFAGTNFQRVIRNCVDNGGAMHVMGLIQDEGVHAHQDHLFSILRYASRAGVKDIFVHAFLDGRDTPPRSAEGYVLALEEVLKECGTGRIGSVMGRYYSMDRSKSWRLTDAAFNALVALDADRASGAMEAIKRSYEKDRTPDGVEMSDEYVPPTVIGDFPGIRDGDSVVHFNYRQDRAIQLTMAFVEDDYPGNRRSRPKVVYCGLTKYYDSFNFNMLSAMTAEGGMDRLLGQVISEKGLRQLRIAETQKFRHVTSFFNGKKIEPYEGEKRIEIKGVFDPATYASHPEMNARDVTQAVVAEIAKEEFAFIAVNFANCDMVGHTGNQAAAAKAVSVVDECVGRVVEAVLAVGGRALVTADHGNAEEMFDTKSGLPKTAHTTNPVDFIYIAADHERVSVREGGRISDVAPTVLSLLEIEQPAEMTAHNLIGPRQ